MEQRHLMQQVQTFNASLAMTILRLSCMWILDFIAQESLAVTRKMETFSGVQVGISKRRGRMVVSRHRRGNFDHYD